MKSRRWVSTLAALGVAVASLPSRAETAESWSAGSPPAACLLAGSWVGSSPPIPGFYANPLLGTVSVSPTDPSCRRFTAAAQPVNGDSTFGGVFPDADEHPDTVGTYVRTGRRSHRFTWIAYFVKSPPAGSFDRAQVLYFWTFAGSVDFLDPDTHKLTGLLSLYSNVDRPDLVVPPLGIFGVHDQDTDDDGFADEGEAPFASFTDFEMTYRRLPLMP
jgi:hypothetical protein